MKQYESLYINGQLVNIGTSDITLEWKSVMFSNISKLKVNHSYTIKLPMTANNRKVFTMADKKNVRLECTECKHINYLTRRNPKSTPEKLEQNKFCKFCRKVTVHKETKAK